jgi:Subtilase family
MPKIDKQKGDRPRDLAADQFRQLPLLLLILVVFSLAMLGSATVAIASSGEPAIPARPQVLLPSDAGTSGAGKAVDSSPDWIVAGRPGQGTRRIAELSGASGIAKGTGIYRIDRSEAVELAGRLDRSGRLVYAEPDVPLVRDSYPSDLFDSQQWWLSRIVNPTDFTPPPVSGSSPLLALIEESADPLHPDLTEANLANPSPIGPTEDWHGTAVAGIAGSPGEMLGLRGVWPGARMRLVPSGTTCSTATQAVVRAIKRGASVINMSYGFPADTCYSHYVATEAAVRAGVLPVASAGNSGLAGMNAPSRPATDPHVLSVSAVDGDGVVADFATRNDGVDLTAPGVDVLGPNITLRVGTDGSETVVRGWGLLNGTSFSTPMVSAAAAMLEQSRPNLDARRIGRLLTRSADDLGPRGRDPAYGEGLLDIDAAMAAGKPAGDPKEPNDDIPWLDGSMLGKKAGFLWKPRKGRRRSIAATLSKAKDPADVYRVRIPPRRKLLITAAQYQGDVALSVLKPGADSIVDPGKKEIVSSDRVRPKTEGVKVRNLKRKSRLIYVAVEIGSRQKSQYSRYRLTVARRR